MKLHETLAQLTPPVGQSSLIAALIGAIDPATIPDRKTVDLAASLEQVRARIGEVTRAQETCGSDAAHWAHEGELAYLRCVAHLHEAAAIVGPDNLPNVALPKPGGVLMDLCARLERFGQEVLHDAANLKAEQERHPDKADKMISKRLELDGATAARLGKPVIDAVSRMIGAGEDKHVVLGAALYAMGSITASLGVVLKPSDPVERALGPLAAGYKQAMAVSAKVDEQIAREDVQQAAPPGTPGPDGVIDLTGGATPVPGLQAHVEIAMSGAEMNDLANPILDRLNELRASGQDGKKIMVAMMYVTGQVMGFEGLHLDYDGPVRGQLAILAQGHAAAEHDNLTGGDNPIGGHA